MNSIQSQNTALQFYPSPHHAWDAMYEDCAKATQSIEFEQYILCADAAGQRFLDLFAQKAKEGVQVRLLLDRVGSRGLYDSKAIKTLRDNGGTVFFYNPIGWNNLFKPATWFPRNHTKTMLIDTHIAYIGSVCVEECMRHWRDTHVRITGDVVRDIERGFVELWDRMTRKIKTRKVWKVGEGPIAYAINRPRMAHNPIYQELLARIRTAKKSVWLVTPYFLPPRRLRRALLQASLRGVDVRVMMAEKSDVRLADLVSRSYFPAFMRKGLRVFLYRKSILHAKYVVIDDDWATIGSTNMDYLSLMKNREANLIIRDPSIVAELAQHFQDDLTHCHEETPEHCGAYSTIDRLIGYLGRTIRRIL